jgi:DNA polymerase-3 subunit epsilon
MLSKKAVDSLPNKPGVYFFKDKSSQILYIGKAKSLKDRVRSYTYRHYKHSKRTRKLIQKAKSVDYTLCGSELEALLLESRLIKEHLPEYNILQRRFKSCPFIKITLNENFPRIYVTWEIEIDGAKYLGPYSNREQAEGTVEVIHKLFPIRWCDADIKPRSRRPPCLKYDVKKCSGPCLGKITSKDYKKIINTIITLLSGKKDKIISDMEGEMRKTATALNFEKARIIRDRINLIREAIFRRQFQVNAVDNNNLIAIYPSKDNGYAEMFFIRKGGLVGQRSVSFQENELTQTIVSDIERIFFQPNRNSNKTVSKFEIDAMNIISRWLYRHRNDQSFVHIKRKRNRAETILTATNEVKRVLESLNQNEKEKISSEWTQEDS